MIVWKNMLKHVIFPGKQSKIDLQDLVNYLRKLRIKLNNCKIKIKNLKNRIIYLYKNNT